MIVEGLLAALAQEGFKKLFELGREHLATELLDLTDGHKVSTVIEVAVAADTRDPGEGELRVELVVQGSAWNREVKLPFGEKVLLRVPRDEYLITALVLFVGPGVDRTAPMLAACGQERVWVASGRRQTITLRAMSPNLWTAERLGFPADRLFRHGKRPVLGRALSVRQRMKLLRKISAGAELSSADKEDLFRSSAHSAAQQRARAEEFKLRHTDVATCSARTPVGGPCLDRVEDHGLCRNHLEKARMGGRVLWHATGQPVSLPPSPEL